MKKVTRRTAAKLLLKITHTSSLVRKLYPVAIELLFPNVKPDKLLHLGQLLKPRPGYRLVRFGSAHDGGYVLADMDFSNLILLSFGVGDNIDFEYEFQNKVSYIEMFDHTVNEPPIILQNGHFNKIGVGPIAANGFVTIPNVLLNYDDSSEFMLKIDIEGSEWDVFSNMDGRDFEKFSQIIGELHGLQNFVNDLDFQGKVLDSLDRISNTHDFIYIHGNNWAKVDLIGGFQLPDVIEFCAVRKDIPLERDQNYCDGLHKPNNPEACEIYLGFLSH